MHVICPQFWHAGQTLETTRTSAAASVLHNTTLQYVSVVAND